MSNLDLDALERGLRHDFLEEYGDSGDVDVEEYLAVIQRLREAETQSAGRLEHMKLYVATLQTLQDRIAQLERVREAAAELQKAKRRYFEGSLKERVPNGALINEAEAKLDAALAAVEEPEKVMPYSEFIKGFHEIS